MREPRSIVFYAWASLTIQCALVAGVTAYALAGGLSVAALALVLPMIVVAAGLRWASRPLHAITRMVRMRSLGDNSVRAVPGGQPGTVLSSFTPPRPERRG